MTIQYIAGPFEIGLISDCGGITRGDEGTHGPSYTAGSQPGTQSPVSGRKPAGADAAVVSVPYPTDVNEARFPSRAESVFHRDYADRRPLLADDFAPVTRCDRCVIVLGTVFVAGIYTLLWCFEFIRRAQAVVASGVSP